MKLYSLLLLLILSLILLARPQQEDVEISLRTFLSAHSAALETQQCYDATWYSTGEDYIQGKWKSMLPPNTPTFVFPFCVDANSLGNIIGMYYNEASCAKIIGGHFVMNRKAYPDIQRGRNPNGDARAYFDALPTIVINENARNESEVKKALEGPGNECDCRHYCWTDVKAPWTKNMEWIRTTAKSAADMFMKTVDTSQGTHIGRHDNSTIPTNKFHPLIPDVVIHYRCGDNLRFDSIGYGLLPYHAILERVPSNSSYIYVISDAVKRVGAISKYDYSGHCHRILSWLQKNLTEAFPNATVLIKRGGDPLLDIARITHADVTICSASTFCFFAALGAHGKVYFPKGTNLIAKPDIPNNRNFTFKSIGSKFEWIDEPLLFISIYHPWYSIEYALTGRPFVPEDQVGRILQGNGKRLWFIYKTPQGAVKRRRIPNTDVMDGLGMHFTHIWYLRDNFINLYEEDPNQMNIYEDPTIKYHFDVETTRYWCHRCPPPYNTSLWVDDSHLYSSSSIGSSNSAGTSTSISVKSSDTSGPYGCRWKTPHVFACD